MDAEFFHELGKLQNLNSFFLRSETKLGAEIQPLLNAKKLKKVFIQHLDEQAIQLLLKMDLFRLMTKLKDHSPETIKKMKARVENFGDFY